MVQGMEVTNTATTSKARDNLVYFNNDDNLFAENGHLQV